MKKLYIKPESACIVSYDQILEYNIPSGSSHETEAKHMIGDVVEDDDLGGNSGGVPVLDMENLDD